MGVKLSKTAIKGISVDKLSIGINALYDRYNSILAIVEANLEYYA